MYPGQGKANRFASVVFRPSSRSSPYAVGGNSFSPSPSCSIFSVCPICVQDFHISRAWTPSQPMPDTKSVNECPPQSSQSKYALVRQSQCGRHCCCVAALQGSGSHQGTSISSSDKQGIGEDIAEDAGGAKGGVVRSKAGCGGSGAKRRYALAVLSAVASCPPASVGGGAEDTPGLGVSGQGNSIQ
jgi:hypothetical protein